MLGITQRCRLGIDSSFLLAGICRAKDSQSFGISGHDPVLDSVVYHLDEVTCAVWTAVQISLFCRAGEFLPSRRTCDVAWPRSECGENRVEVLNHGGLTTDHQAIAAFKTPHPAACSDVHIVNSSRLEFLPCELRQNDHSPKSGRHYAQTRFPSGPIARPRGHELVAQHCSPCLPTGSRPATRK